MTGNQDMIREWSREQAWHTEQASHYSEHDDPIGAATSKEWADSYARLIESYRDGV